MSPPGPPAGGRPGAPGRDAEVGPYARPRSPRTGVDSRVPMADEPAHLRVLIANERRDRLELLAQVVAGLGHEVIAREIDVEEVGAVTARERPDVALVGLGLDSGHALELISGDRPRSRLPRDRAALGERSRLRPRGGQTRRLRLHRRRQPRGAAERDRHHPAALRRVPEPAGSVRAPGADRAGEGHPDGPPRDRRRRRVRAAPRPLAAQRPQARRRRRRRSSTAISCCCRRSHRRHSRPRPATDAAVVAARTAASQCEGRAGAGFRMSRRRPPSRSPVESAAFAA